MLRVIQKILLVLIVTYIGLLFVNYHILLGKKENEAKENARVIEAVLVENFEQVEKILNLVGKRISDEAPSLDPAIIHKIFVQTAATQGYRDNFSWSLFDWVDTKGYQTVNTILGVRRSNPSYVASDRNYSHRGSDQWKLILSEAAIGNPSGVYVIPVGMQINTKKYPRAGTVSAGISIKKLVNIIALRLSGNNSFIVLDKRNERIAFGSYDVAINDGNYFDDFQSVPKNNRYIFSKTMDEKYPYIIKTGYDRAEFWQAARASSGILLFQIIGVVLLFAVLKK